MKETLFLLTFLNFAFFALWQIQIADKKALRKKFNAVLEQEAQFTKGLVDKYWLLLTEYYDLKRKNK